MPSAKNPAAPDCRMRIDGKGEWCGSRARADDRLTDAGAGKLVDESPQGLDDGRAGHGARPVDQGCTSPNAEATTCILFRDSSHSRAGSESATMPHTANSAADRPETTPQRSATTNSPSPSAPTQPSGPAYQPRSKPSCSAMSSRASERGSPATAGVGC